MAPEVQDPKKLLKIVSCAKTERSNGGGSSGIGGWPPISTWIKVPVETSQKACLHNLNLVGIEEPRRLALRHDEAI
jgi:hypothetical protein